MSRGFFECVCGAVLQDGEKHECAGPRARRGSLLEAVSGYRLPPGVKPLAPPADSPWSTVTTRRGPSGERFPGQDNSLPVDSAGDAFVASRARQRAPRPRDVSRGARFSPPLEFEDRWLRHGLDTVWLHWPTPERFWPAVTRLLGRIERAKAAGASEADFAHDWDALRHDAEPDPASENVPPQLSPAPEASSTPAAATTPADGEHASENVPPQLSPDAHVVRVGVQEPGDSDERESVNRCRIGKGRYDTKYLFTVATEDGWQILVPSQKGLTNGQMGILIIPAANWLSSHSLAAVRPRVMELLQHLIEPGLEIEDVALIPNRIDPHSDKLVARMPLEMTHITKRVVPITVDQLDPLDALDTTIRLLLLTSKPALVKQARGLMRSAERERQRVKREIDKLLPNLVALDPLRRAVKRAGNERGMLLALEAFYGDAPKAIRERLEAAMASLRQAIDDRTNAYRLVLQLARPTIRDKGLSVLAHLPHRSQEEPSAVVCRAKDRRPFVYGQMPERKRGRGRPPKEDLMASAFDDAGHPGIRLGQSEIVFRCYDKTRQAEKEGDLKHWLRAWGGLDLSKLPKGACVQRFEFQLRGDYLKRFKAKLPKGVYSWEWVLEHQWDILEPLIKGYQRSIHQRKEKRGTPPHVDENGHTIAKHCLCGHDYVSHLAFTPHRHGAPCSTKICACGVRHQHEWGERCGPVDCGCQKYLAADATGEILERHEDRQATPWIAFCAPAMGKFHERKPLAWWLDYVDELERLHSTNVLRGEGIRPARESDPEMMREFRTEPLLRGSIGYAISYQVKSELNSGIPQLGAFGRGLAYNAKDRQWGISELTPDGKRTIRPLVDEDRARLLAQLEAACDDENEARKRLIRADLDAEEVLAAGVKAVQKRYGGKWSQAA